MKLSELIQHVYNDLGKTERFIATGGTTTTVINSIITAQDDPPEDNYALDYSLFVHRTTDNAAPVHEFQRISAYTSTGGTFTIDTALTAAVGAGDEIVVASNEIPLWQMIWAANRALSEIGPVEAVPDTSLTTGSDQTEYTLPAAIVAGRIRGVYYQGETGNANDNYWIPTSWKVEPGTYGSTGTLIIPQVDDGVTLKIIYDGVHSELTAYNSEISPSIPERLAIAATSVMALRWYISNNEGTEDFWLQRANEAGQDFERWMPNVKQVQKKIFGMPQWTHRDKWPGDSDAL